MLCFYAGGAYVQLGVRQKMERMTHMNNHEYQFKKEKRSSQIENGKRQIVFCQ